MLSLGQAVLIYFGNLDGVVGGIYS